MYVCINVSVCLHEIFFVVVLCACVCLCVCGDFLLCARKPFWPLRTPQAVSTAVELLNSGPACSDYTNTRTHTGVLLKRILYFDLSSLLKNTKLCTVCGITFLV